MSKSYSSGDFGNFTLSTYRTIGGYRTCAYQGAKSSTSSSSSSARICYGHIVPDAIPRVKNLLRVEYCKIEYKAHSCGIHSIDRTLSFNVCTNNNDIPDMIRRIGFTLPKQGDSKTYTQEGWTGSELCNFMYDFLTRGTMLCLYNGETTYEKSQSYYDGTGYGSKNYAAIESFKIVEMRIVYQP